MHSPKMEQNKRFLNEILAVYATWQKGGHTPYEYLFVYPRVRLEIDYAVLNIGSEYEMEELRKIEKQHKY